MAVYHLHVKLKSRTAGHSAVACAAYRSGEKLTDERYGQVRDYTKKDGVIYSGIITPTNAPAWAADRGKLWNEVERVEIRKDAQVAREVEFSLPVELNSKQHHELAREFIKEEFVSKGMIADYAIHDKRDGNPHCHVMLTTRTIGPEGFGQKERNWNARDWLVQLREAWAAIANQGLAMIGRRERIDHRTLKAQGIDRVPTKHRGPNNDNALKRARAQLNRLVGSYDIFVDKAGQVHTVELKPQNAAMVGQKSPMALRAEMNIMNIAAAKKAAEERAAAELKAAAEAKAREEAIARQQAAQKANKPKTLGELIAEAKAGSVEAVERAYRLLRNSKGFNDFYAKKDVEHPGWNGNRPREYWMDIEVKSELAIRLGVINEDLRNTLEGATRLEGHVDRMIEREEARGIRPPRRTDHEQDRGR